jgi:hypothetical protein
MILSCPMFVYWKMWHVFRILDCLNKEIYIYISILENFVFKSSKKLIGSLYAKSSSLCSECSFLWVFCVVWQRGKALNIKACDKIRKKGNYLATLHFQPKKRPSAQQKNYQQFVEISSLFVSFFVQVAETINLSCIAVSLDITLSR